MIRLVERVQNLILHSVRNATCNQVKGRIYFGRLNTSPNGMQAWWKTFFSTKRYSLTGIINANADFRLKLQHGSLAEAAFA